MKIDDLSFSKPGLSRISMHFTAEVFSTEAHNLAGLRWPADTSSVGEDLKRCVQAIRDGITLRIQLYNPDTTDFHHYEFEYSSTTGIRTPRKWFLQNCLYALHCRETCENMEDAFPELVAVLGPEYEKIRQAL